MSDDNGLATGWVWTTVSEIASVGTGTTPSRTQGRFWSDGRIPWITSSAVNLPFVSEAEQFVTDQALANTTLKVYPKNTLIVALYGEGKTRGKVSELLIDATINQALAALGLHITDQAHRRFVKYYLQSNYAALRRQAAGGMQPNLNLSLVNRIRVPVAPLNEQGRIVAKIEELFSDLDAGEAGLKRAKANLKRYRAAVLKAAVEGKLTEQWRADHPDAEPASQLLQRILTERRQKWEADQLAKFAASNKTPPKNWRDRYVEPSALDTNGLPELPKGWCWANVDQSVEIIDYRGRTPPYTDAGIPHLRSQNIKSGRIVWEGITFVAPSTFDEYMTRGLPQPGDLLFTTEAPLGEVALAPTETKFSLAQRLILVRPMSLLNSRFLMYQIMSGEFQTRLGLRQTGSTVKRVSSRNFRPAAIRIPPLDEQQRIVEDIEGRLSVVEPCKNSFAAIELRASRLRQSILKYAFEGKLVPQDPRDEPASVLLERLRTTPPDSNEPTPGKPRRRRSKASPSGE